MELWIIATFFAAAFQTLRFMLQKTLTAGSLSATGSTFARFAYTAPGAVLVAVGYLWVTQSGVPSLGLWFWIWALVGGVSQILATVFVVMTFKERSFAVGVTLKKTEVLQTAFIGFVLLGEIVSLGGWLAIAIGLVGVLLLSKTPDMGSLWQGLRSRAVMLGLTSGFFFAICGVGYRATTLEIPSEDPMLRAVISLVMVSSMQALILAVWLAWREPGQIRATWEARKTAIWLGISSLFGTVGWFLAFTLQKAAYVYAVGQVELVFSLMATVLFFREKLSVREFLGIGVLALSIILLVLLG
jgi:drug/metabolite transporter (DMT)-like permease